MLAGRPGFRFALEALFLILLAVGAGLADLRPLVIVLVMAGAWVLVALVEFTAERVSSAPVSYLLPRDAEPQEEDERVEWPMPEERTVVAPPEQREDVAEEPEPELEPEPLPEPEPVASAEDTQEGLPSPRRLRSLLRRREREQEPEPQAPPRHVKLLPRRTAPESSRAAQEVAELFDEPEERKEHGG